MKEFTWRVSDCEELVRGPATLDNVTDLEMISLNLI